MSLKSIISSKIDEFKNLEKKKQIILWIVISFSLIWIWFWTFFLLKKTFSQNNKGNKTAITKNHDWIDILKEKTEKWWDTSKKNWELSLEDNEKNDKSKNNQLSWSVNTWTNDELRDDMDWTSDESKDNVDKAWDWLTKNTAEWDNVKGKWVENELKEISSWEDKNFKTIELLENEKWKWLILFKDTKEKKEWKWSISREKNDYLNSYGFYSLILQSFINEDIKLDLISNQTNNVVEFKLTWIQKNIFNYLINLIKKKKIWEFEVKMKNIDLKNYFWKKIQDYNLSILLNWKYWWIINVVNQYVLLDWIYIPATFLYNQNLYLWNKITVYYITFDSNWKKYNIAVWIYFHELKKFFITEFWLNLYLVNYSNKKKQNLSNLLSKIWWQISEILLSETNYINNVKLKNKDNNKFNLTEDKYNHLKKLFMFKDFLEKLFNKNEAKQLAIYLKNNKIDITEYDYFELQNFLFIYFWNLPKKEKEKVIKKYNFSNNQIKAIKYLFDNIYKDTHLFSFSDYLDWKKIMKIYTEKLMKWFGKTAPQYIKELINLLLKTDYKVIWTKEDLQVQLDNNWKQFVNQLIKIKNNILKYKWKINSKNAYQYKNVIYYDLTFWDFLWYLKFNLIKSYYLDLFNKNKK